MLAVQHICQLGRVITARNIVLLFCVFTIPTSPVELGSSGSLYVSMGTLDLGMRPALQRAACSIPPYPV